MPHKTINSYPSLGEETKLPIFMRAVGCHEFQPLEKREEGYLYHQMFFVEKGELCLFTENKELRLHTGMGFFLHADVPYHIEPLTKPCTTHWVSFGCNCEDMLFPMIGLEKYKLYNRLETNDLKMRLKKMYLLSTEDTFFTRCQNSALMYEYLMEIYAQSEKASLPKEKDSENPALLLAKRYIEQYYFNDLTLDTIATFANVSPQHLCRLFQKQLNMRPTHYINLTRIKVAKWELHNSDKTITEIAEAVGFHTPYYFTNTFKKYENMSPSAYRKLVRS